MNRGGVLNSIFTLLYLFSRNERWERCLMKLLSRTRAWFYFRMALGITFSNSMSQCLTSCYHAEFLQTWWSNTEIREITLAPQHTEEDTSEYLCSASVFPQLSLLKLFFFFLSFFHASLLNLLNSHFSRLETASSVSVEPPLKEWATHRLSTCWRTPRAP